jgi:hypothetical protein
MGIQVTLTYGPWIALFPEFSNTVSEAQFSLWLIVTTTLHRNDGGGPVTNAQSQTTLLSLALAHLCFIYLGTNTQPAAQTVGRINSASEGSVAVTTDYGANVSQSMAFWIQTKYGALYWQMTSVYRTMRWIPNPRPAITSNIYGPGPGPWGNGWGGFGWPNF